MDVRLLSSAQFDALCQQFKPLSKQLFNRASWFLLLTRYVFDCDQKQTLFATVFNGEQPLLTLPLLNEKGTTDSSQAPELRAASNYYTTYYDFIEFQPEQDATQLLATLFRYLKVKLKLRKITLAPLLHQGREEMALISALKQTGFVTFPYFMFGNWRTKVSSDFTSFISTKPSRLKNTLERKAKQVSKAFTGIEFEIIDNDSGDLERGKRDYRLIYDRSWKKNEPYPEFIDKLIEQKSANQSLRLGFLYLDKKPVASQLWFVDQSNAYIYKLAYDPSYSKYSVGSLLSEYMFKHVIDVDQCHNIDYLSGDDNYKQDWMIERRELWGVVAYNKVNAVSLLQAVVERTTRILAKIKARLA